MVTSTTGSMLRTSHRLSFSFIHKGVSASKRIPLITLETNRGQASPADRVTGNVSSIDGLMGSIFNSATSRLLISPVSLASPVIPRQSLRLGVRSKSIIASLRFKTPLTSAPTSASAGSSIKPSWSSEMPSSRSEHNMPNDSTPRSFAFLILKSSSFAPTSAKGTLIPERALGAPHTTCNCSSPVETAQTLNLSAFG